MADLVTGGRPRRTLPRLGLPLRSLVLLQLAVVGLVLVVLPVSGRQLPGSTSFVPAMVALVGCFDLLCAVLLILHFRDVGDRRALVLSWAYVTSLVLLGGYAAAFPGVLGPEPPLGANVSSAPWLWAAWHTVFPVLLGVAAGPWPARWQRTVSVSRRARWVWLTTSFCVAAGAAFVSAVVVFDKDWPVLIVGTDTSSMTRVVGPVVLPLALAGAGAAMVGAWRAGGLGRWAALAATTAAGDVVLTLFSTYRFSTGWYAGRTLTVISSAVVLIALLAEFSGIKRRLAAEGVRLRAQLARTDQLERLQRTLLEHMADGVVMQGRDGRVVASNPAAEQLVGLSADQLAGQAPLDPRWRMLDADGSPLDPAHSHGPASRTLQSGTPEREQVIGIEQPDRPVRWLSVNTAAARADDGTVDYVVASMHDITHRHTRDLAAARGRREARARIEDILTRDAPTVVFQPIVALGSGLVVGAEALSRFVEPPNRGPNVWFAEAADVGLGPDLELAAIRSALRALGTLAPRLYLSVNASPTTVVLPEFAQLLSAVDPKRVVIELTEHASVDDYDSLQVALSCLRDRGVRLAVDDAGAGFASLRHILTLRPDIIKLDLAITRGLHTDPARRALAAALLNFGQDIGASVIAEGIESQGELDALRALGIQFGQGYALGRPGSLPLPTTVVVKALQPVTAPG